MKKILTSVLIMLALSVSMQSFQAAVIDPTVEETEAEPNYYDESGEVCANLEYTFEKVDATEKNYYEYYLLNTNKYIVEVLVNNTTGPEYTFKETGEYILRTYQLDENSDYQKINSSESDQELQVIDCEIEADASTMTEENDKSAELRGTLKIRNGQLEYEYTPLTGVSNYEILYNFPELTEDESSEEPAEGSIEAKSSETGEINFTHTIKDATIVQIVEKYEENSKTIEESYNIEINPETESYIIKNVDGFDVKFANNRSLITKDKIILLVIEVSGLVIVSLLVSSLKKKNKLRKKYRKQRRRGNEGDTKKKK